ncbi:MAG: DNA polymerase III subunit delta' [Chloroflexota bacterium]|jgi:DNA polymerase-3 subunit delta'
MSEWQKIIGHQWAVEVLRSAIQHDRVGHAYLVTGPTQVGKGTLARIFAQALNCTAAGLDQRPCGLCRSCKLIAANRHPDVKIVAGEASGRGKVTLKIDQIRELQGELNLTAAEARVKVAIVEGFETANQSAANAFLKTLEEPPGHTVLILTATTAETLLPTITSRCRTIGLRPLPTGLIETSLVQRWDVEPQLARTLAHLADGRIGRAVSLAQAPELLEERAEQLDLLYGTFDQSRVKRFAAADRLAGSPEQLPDLLQLWLGFWRDLILMATSGAAGEALSNVDQIQRLTGYARTWPAAEILSCLRKTEEALWQLERNANTRLVMENLLLSYPSLQSISP